jgi:hypothetical protein
MQQLTLTARTLEAVLFFSLKKMFRGTLILTPGNHHFMVQIGKNKMQSMDKIYNIFRGTRPPRKIALASSRMLANSVGKRQYGGKGR